MDLIAQRCEPFRQQKRLQVRSLMVSALGDVGLPSGTELERFGLNHGTARP